MPVGSVSGHSNSSNRSRSVSSSSSTSRSQRSAPVPQARPARITDGFDRPATRADAVKSVQRALGMQQVDGLFGPNTQRAVETYQRQKNLQVDGVVGPQTWGSLFGGSYPQGIGGNLRRQDSFSSAPAGGVTSTSGVRAGGGWGGTERLADRVVEIAREMGIPVTSTKRTATGSIGSTSRSDHHVSQRNAYAVDLGVSGPRGNELARRIADAYGIRGNVVGNFDRHTINVDGQRYRMQVLYGVANHYDHVHVGFRRM